MQPIGPTFHKTFPIQLPVLSSFLRALKECGPEASQESIRQASGIGTMKVPASFGYAKGAGFLDHRQRLTPLGARVLEKDPGFESPTTLWLLHAGLCGVSPMAPLFWRALWQALRPGESVERARLVQKVLECYPQGRLKQEYAGTCVTVFASSYLKPEGLLSLRLLEGGGSALHSPLREADPPTGVFAYAVVELWDRMHPGQLTSDLDGFVRESGITEVFRISAPRAVSLLEGVRNLGLIDLYRSAPPFQIVRRWTDALEALDCLYDADV